MRTRRCGRRREAQSPRLKWQLHFRLAQLTIKGVYMGVIVQLIVFNIVVHAVLSDQDEDEYFILLLVLSLEYQYVIMHHHHLDIFLR